MSETDDLRKDGYYTVILFDKDKKQTFLLSVIHIKVDCMVYLCIQNLPPLLLRRY